MTARRNDGAGVRGRRSYQSAASRWASIGPYIGVFPASFAGPVIERFTEPGDTVLDPFSGRSTALFAAATRRRRGLGAEINPVGWVYGKAKLEPASRARVESRLAALDELAADYASEAEALPEFFHRCFSAPVRRALVAARAELNWRRRRSDWTAMALLLVYLHGRAGTALSNQMPHLRSLSPHYALRWWRERQLEPPEIDSIAGFMAPRLDWRYRRGVPETSETRSYLGDCLEVLGRINGAVTRGEIARARLVLTSPPYFARADYHYDQWIRRWLLGGPADARRLRGRAAGKFDHLGRYRRLLERAFARTARVVARDAVIYVRASAAEPTRAIAIAALRASFPTKAMQLLADEAAGEVDIVLTPR